MFGLPLLKPDWDAPPNVRAAVSMRDGGVSDGRYGSFNLSYKVGDDEEAVGENRMRFEAALGGSNGCAWLDQAHSSEVVPAHEVAISGGAPAADASWTDQRGIACVVLTADCVPVLMASLDGGKVAAAHAGWRGLAAGVIKSTAAVFGDGGFTAYVGPCISALRYEIGGDVRDSLRAAGIDGAALIHGDDGGIHADLALIAKSRLQDCGASSVACAPPCTYTDRKRFFSARRDGGRSGRFASAVWMALG